MRLFNLSTVLSLFIVMFTIMTSCESSNPIDEQSQYSTSKSKANILAAGDCVVESQITQSFNVTIKYDDNSTAVLPTSGVGVYTYPTPSGRTLVSISVGSITLAPGNGGNTTIPNGPSYLPVTVAYSEYLQRWVTFYNN